MEYILYRYVNQLIEQSAREHKVEPATPATFSYNVPFHSYHLLFHIDFY